MEELLTRCDILEILAKRHLDMSQIERLSQSELLRIYKKFVVPLGRREFSSVHNKAGQGENWTTHEHAQKRPLLVPMEIDFTPPATPPVNDGEMERSMDTDTDFTILTSTCQSSAAKRIKIDLS